MKVTVMLITESNLDQSYVIMKMLYMRTITVNGIIVVFILTLLIVLYTNKWRNSSINDMSKYKLAEKKSIPIKLMVQKVLIPDEKNIFFMETTCIFEKIPPGGLHLTSRQLCSIFSAAKMNPLRSIILYHSCPLHLRFYERSSDGAKHLLKLSNFYLITAEFEDILQGSPVENIWTDLKRSSYPIEHSADVLRLLLLYNYGGAYMDLDFISMKSLDSLPKNVLAPESNISFSNGFLQFERNGKGNDFLRMTLEELSKSFNGDSWSGNGPYLIQKSFFKFCNNDNKDIPILEVPTDSCEISLSEVRAFYPVHYPEWRLLFNSAATTAVLKKIHQFNNTIAVHFWNFLSKNEKVTIGENSTYEYLAREYCNQILIDSSSGF